jgi:hypothetical protein
MPKMTHVYASAIQPGDTFDFSKQLCTVTKVAVNDHGDIVLQFVVAEQPNKAHRSMLIVRKNFLIAIPATS